MALIKYDWCPHQKRRLGDRHTEKRPYEDTGRRQLSFLSKCPLGLWLGKSSFNGLVGPGPYLDGETLEAEIVDTIFKVLWEGKERKG